jgi:AcrR family transcriptional regulator
VTTSPRATDLEGAAGDVRERIAAAAFELFETRGYESTTVDAVAEQAGVARRTFFRYFRSKDDVIFPDHERLVEAVGTHLAATSGGSPVRAVCGGARLILHRYVAAPRTSVQRYQLTRSVPALRDREIASVSQYQRLFSRYLREGSGGAGMDALHAEVVAAAVVAAHNQVLRVWLRGGAVGDPLPSLDLAFDHLVSVFEPGEGPSTGEAAATADRQSGVVVAVISASGSVQEVARRIRQAL